VLYQLFQAFRQACCKHLPTLSLRLHAVRSPSAVQVRQPAPTLQQASNSARLLPLPLWGLMPAKQATRTRLPQRLLACSAADALPWGMLLARPSLLRARGSCWPAGPTRLLGCALARGCWSPACLSGPLLSGHELASRAQPRRTCRACLRLDLVSSPALLAPRLSLPPRARRRCSCLPRSRGSGTSSSA
jgi:hypothetical protein